MVYRCAEKEEVARCCVARKLTVALRGCSSPGRRIDKKSKLPPAPCKLHPTWTCCLALIGGSPQGPPPANYADSNPVAKTFSPQPAAGAATPTSNPPVPPQTTTLV